MFKYFVKTGPKRGENGFQSNGSCETAHVKSFHLTTAPHWPEVHAALEPFQAGNGQLLFFDLVPNCPLYSVQIAGRKNLRFYSPEGVLDMSIFTEYISVEVYNQTPKNKLEKYLISGGSTKFSTVCVYRY